MLRQQGLATGLLDTDDQGGQWNVQSHVHQEAGADRVGCPRRSRGRALAFAFWTTSGSGSGSATAGTDAGVTVSGDPANGIYPGGSVPVTTTVTNSSSTQSQYVAEPARGDLDRLGARYRWLLGELVHVQG